MRIISTPPKGQRNKRTCARRRRQGVLLSFDIDVGAHDIQWQSQKRNGEKFGVSEGGTQRGWVMRMARGK